MPGIFDHLGKTGIGAIKFSDTRGINMHPSGKYLNILVGNFFPPDEEVEVTNEEGETSTVLQPVEREPLLATGSLLNSSHSKSMIVVANPTLCKGHASFTNLIEAEHGGDILEIVDSFFYSYIQKVKKNRKGNEDVWMFRIYVPKETS